MSTKSALVPGFAIAAAMTLAAGAQTIEVIFSEAPGHPTAQVPGARDLDGKPVATEFKAMELLAFSPDGAQWIIKSRNHLGSDLETMLVAGSGTAGSVLAQEGQPVHDGADGELYEFFGSGPPSFDEQGRFVYTARARGGDPDTKQKGIFFDGDAFHMIRRESDPAEGLIDNPPGESGDELFGNSFGSMHLLNDGTIGSHDTTIKNIHSSRRPALFYGDTSFVQVGITPIEARTWNRLDANTFRTTPDGATWVVIGEDDGPDATDVVLAVDGAVLLREGSTIGASSVVMADVFNVDLRPDGTVYSRGDDAADDDWAARGDTLLAATGDLVAGTNERWGAAFLSLTGNAAGDWVLAGATDRADVETDSVIVRNGTEVLVREGDPVDLDGNGKNDDDAFIGRGNATLSAFRPNALFLADDGTLWFLASLRDGAGNDLGEFGTGGDAFLRLAAAAACPADLDDSGDVGFGDVLAVLAAWGPCDKDCPEDLDESGDVGFADLLIVLAAWGPCA